MRQDAPLFSNGAWTIVGAGLEHDNGYFIEREAIGARTDDGLWLWPLHMADKPWCSPRPFVEAFLRAVLAFGFTPDLALSRSLAPLRDPARGDQETSDPGFVALGACAQGLIKTMPRRSMAVEVDTEAALAAPRRRAA